LTPASGRQDHTTSPSAAASFVRTHFARLTPQRPPHPAPYVRDDREAPLLWEQDDRSFRDDLGWLKTKIFLQTGLDRLMGDLPVGRSYRPKEIELPRPDDIVRKELVQLYGRGLPLGEAAQRTKGVSAAFIKELMRRIAQASIARDGGTTVESGDIGEAAGRYVVRWWQAQRQAAGRGATNRRRMKTAFAPRLD
jgi:hypothetical protein